MSSLTPMDGEVTPESFAPGMPRPKVTEEQARSRREVAQVNKETHPYMKAGEGESPFEATGNDGFGSDQLIDYEGAPKEIEDFTQTEREAWLKDGTLPPLEKEAKPKSRSEDSDESSEAKRPDTEERETGAAKKTADTQAYAPPADYEKYSPVERDRTAKAMEKHITEGRISRPMDELLGTLIAQESQRGLKNGFGIATHITENPEIVQEIHRLATAGDGAAINRMIYKLDRELDSRPRRPAAKMVSDALPPPREIGGKGTGDTDTEEAALKRDDVSRYMELANKREALEYANSRGRRRR